MSESQAGLSTPPKPSVSQLDYLIGWICILPSEYYEAIKMFDETYETAHIVRGRGDKNSYDLGRIGEHRVVMNCPAAGTCGQIHATRIASDMKSTFPAIRFVLLVGIGGGSPRKHDVRLGDVVLGTKVIPYRKGKETDTGFMITGHIGVPPPVLQAAITRLGSQLQRGLNLQKTIESLGRLGPNAILRPKQDNLYKREYFHGSDCDCLNSEAQAFGAISHRSCRQGDLVQTHQGIVGSADQVMKTAQHRDEYAGRYDIICYEMEAIGVMETTSCLTIRGISDYSDGHKNDDWHSYASLAAAVCSKELLKIIPAQSVLQCPMEITQEELERTVRGAVHQVSSTMHQSTGPQNEYQTAERNLDMIMERYGLVQNLIAPELYDLGQTSALEEFQQVRDKVTSMEDLQKDLQESLDSLRSQIRKQAKRRDNSFVARENWKALKHKVDERARSVAEISKTTHRALASASSTSRRFLLVVGKKGNRTIHDAGDYISKSSLQAIEHLKVLMAQFTLQFRPNREGSSCLPPHENPHSITSREDVTETAIPEASRSPSPASQNVRANSPAPPNDSSGNPLSPSGRLPPPPPLPPSSDISTNSAPSPPDRCPPPPPSSDSSNNSAPSPPPGRCPPRPNRQPPPLPPPRRLQNLRTSEDGVSLKPSLFVTPGRPNEDSGTLQAYNLLTSLRAAPPPPPLPSVQSSRASEDGSSTSRSSSVSPARQSEDSIYYPTSQARTSSTTVDVSQRLYEPLSVMSRDESPERITEASRSLTSSTVSSEGVDNNPFASVSDIISRLQAKGGDVMGRPLQVC